jgi:hypothetical protein
MFSLFFSFVRSICSDAEMAENTNINSVQSTGTTARGLNATPVKLMYNAILVKAE